MIYSYFLFMMFVVFMMMSIYLYFLSMSVMVEWVIFSLNSVMIEMYFLVDWVCCLFSSFVLMISSMVIVYSIIYMMGDSTLNRFLILVLMFVMSMLLMIVSPSLISILFGWDLLGLVSYCLVIYYQNYNSFNSGMVTVLSNRVGDVGLLMAIGLAFTYGSWNIYMLENKYLLLLFILVAAVTKSAQMPFSSWLPMAMAAPTPVSALVHSSTLVTAGVYLIVRFNNFIMLSGTFLLLLFMSVFTMIMSGLMANFEFDLKKIIALSTLSQLGLMMMILSLGGKLLGVYHLLTHAVFKSLLFMGAGGIIHMFKGNQDIRCYGNLSSMLPFLSIGFYISVLSLMGFPFLAGFYSKDLIMEMSYVLEVNLVLEVLVMLSISLTVSYSFRLCYYLFYGSMKENPLGLINESGLMNLSMLLLMFMSVISGAMLNWLFFYNLSVMYMSELVKMLTMMFFLSGAVSWFLMKEIFVMNYKKSIMMFSVSMWFLNFFYMSGSKFVLYMSYFFGVLDREWVESAQSIFWFNIKLFMSKNYYSSFKLYNIIFNQLFILLFVIYMLSVTFKNS